MKAAGSYQSLLRGVSQQPQEVRQPGQHTELVNMLSDPVAGLTRRPGTRLQRTERLFGGGVLSEAQMLTKFASSNSYRTIAHTSEGKDYILLMRSEAQANGLSTSLPPVVCYNITDKVFCPVTFVGGQAGDAGLSLNLNGISAAASLGRYIVYAQNARPVAVPFIAPWPGSAFTASVVWVRGGAYDRTYAVYFSGGLLVASYTTPAAGAPGAATAISPQNIAIQLNSAIAGLGYATIQNGSHIYIAGTPLITSSDGGDGTLMRTMTNDIQSTDNLTVMAYQGQKVRVGKSAASPGYYLQADVQGGGFSTAIWRETAGDSRPGSLITNVGLIRVKNNNCYVGMFDGSSPGAGINAVAGETAPEFVGAGAGDEISSPTPKWMRGQINYLGVFQDRLLVGSGGTLSVSAAGDYFNFFRSTVLTTPLKDPFEMTPQGGEDDILRHSVPYNKNLVVFGDKKQYLISGSQALTPTSPNMAVMTVYADAAKCPPLAAGGQIYYARNRDGSVALHQIQPGAYVDSAESFPASAQIGTYIPSPAAELETVPGAPARMIVRSRAVPTSLYVFTYLDQPDGRKQEAWDRWDYNPKCGRLLGVLSVPDGLMTIWARWGSDGYVYLAADLQPMNPELSALPYMDSLRNWDTYAALAVGLQDVKLATSTGWVCSFDATSERFLIGGNLPDRAAIVAEYPTESAKLWAGLEYDSYVIPTNPLVKDKNDKAILSGRTVITRLLASFKKTSGLDATVTSANTVAEYNFNGRILGDLLNQIGKIPIASTSHSIAIGRETREYEVKLSSQKWYPLTFVNIEWTGQIFNRTPRA